jgi:S-formylglutathione hydrolase FrmB
MLSVALASSGARVEVMNLASRVLVGNALRDPVERKVAVVLPRQYAPGTPLPVVMYLEGFGGSSEDVIKNAPAWSDLVQKIADEVTPMVFVVPDGRNRFGCSQYINSTASGRYEDYLCEEVLPAVERAYHCGGKAELRLVAGHSSGGFGALRLGMSRQRQFGSIIALSPDSYFDVTHRPLALDPGCAKVTPAEVKALQTPTFARFEGFEGEAPYVIALSACYAGNPDGTFEWIYDEQGRFREDIYQRWLAADPLTRAKRRHAFAAHQHVYLEGPDHDDFRANVGARAIFDALAGRHRTTFYEPPGHHSDHLFDRIQRGIAWCLDRPTADITNN